MVFSNHQLATPTLLEATPNNVMLQFHTATIMPRKLNFTPSPPPYPEVPYNISNTQLGVNLTPTDTCVSTPVVQSTNNKDKGKKVIYEPESEIEQYNIIGHTIPAVTISRTAFQSIHIQILNY